MRAIADPSAIIGVEAGRIDADDLRRFDLSVSAITVGELEAGVACADASTWQLRARTLLRVLAVLPVVSVDRRVAGAYGTVAGRVRESEGGVGYHDAWIAATALSEGLPVVTQDRGCLRVEGLEVILV
ncbi:MAG: PIN domain-containing protein [Actinomycetota bacterium]